MSLTKLTQLTQLAEDFPVDFEVIGEHVPHTEILAATGAGDPQPVIPDNLHAMLIISGCTAQWISLGRYFRVVHKKTGKTTHLSVHFEYEEWREQLNRISKDQVYGEAAQGVF